MKKLELNKILDVELPSGEVEKVEVKKHLISVLSMPSESQRGMNYEEMGSRCDLIKKLKDSGFEALLENIEHKLLCDALKAHKYPFVSTTIHGYIKEVLELPEVEVKEV